MTRLIYLYFERDAFFRECLIYMKVIAVIQTSTLEEWFEVDFQCAYRERKLKGLEHRWMKNTKLSNHQRLDLAIYLQVDMYGGGMILEVCGIYKEVNELTSRFWASDTNHRVPRSSSLACWSFQTPKSRFEASA